MSAAAEIVEIQAPRALKEKVETESSLENPQEEKYAKNEEPSDCLGATKPDDKTSHGCQEFDSAPYGESPGISLHPGNDGVARLCDYMDSMPNLAGPDHSVFQPTYVSRSSDNYRDQQRVPDARIQHLSYIDMNLQAQINPNPQGTASGDHISGSSTSPRISLHSEHSGSLPDTGSIPYLASPHRSELQPTTSSRLEETGGGVHTGGNTTEGVAASGDQSAVSIYEMQLEFSEVHTSSTNQSNTPAELLREATASPRMMRYERSTDDEHLGSPSATRETPECEEAEGNPLNSTAAEPSVAEHETENNADSPAELAMDYVLSLESI